MPIFPLVQNFPWFHVFPWWQFFLHSVFLSWLSKSLGGFSRSPIFHKRFFLKWQSEHHLLWIPLSFGFPKFLGFFFFGSPMCLRKFWKWCGLASIFSRILLFSRFPNFMGSFSNSIWWLRKFLKMGGLKSHSPNPCLVGFLSVISNADSLVPILMEVWAPSFSWKFYECYWILGRSFPLFVPRCTFPSYCVWILGHCYCGRWTGYF